MYILWGVLFCGASTRSVFLNVWPYGRRGSTSLLIMGPENGLPEGPFTNYLKARAQCLRSCKSHKVMVAGQQGIHFLVYLRILVLKKPRFLIPYRFKLSNQSTVNLWIWVNIRKMADRRIIMNPNPDSLICKTKCREKENTSYFFKLL